MAEKVLLIDDEADFLSVMAERLSARGMVVSTAASAEKAIEMVAESSFDAVILDLMMPNIDGIETLKLMKMEKPDLQVILLTGYATVEKGIEAMKLGAMDLVEKPADMSILIGKIRHARDKKMIHVERQNEKRIKKIMGSKAW